MLRHQLTLSPFEFEKIYQNWTALGVIDAYHCHFFLDTFHPVFYGSFLAIAIYHRRRSQVRKKTARLFLIAIPIAAAMCDGAENALHLCYAQTGEIVVVQGLLLSGLFSWIKWILSFFAVVVILKPVRYGPGLLPTKPSAGSHSAIEEHRQAE